ncbi:MAG: FtsX-like permease family protein [Marinilabiliaceae bacterium]|jgi:putative ABC transport system permease protein|nr:FtsX-like permease family protein [Marinilabiliaceae bacterium]
MIRFILKGILRDRHRSVLPIIVTATGVMLTVVFHSWLTGVLDDSIEYNARFSSGHVKILTPAYFNNIDQMPNDFAVIGTDKLLGELNERYSNMDWVERIHFAGLVDIPDKNGETVAQGPALGFGIDMLSGQTEETARMNIPGALKEGSLPSKAGEVLLSESFARKLGVSPGDPLTLIGSTMYRELAIYNFVLSGTVEFGTKALDRGTIIADISDVRLALNMEDAAGEILGFVRNEYFDEEITGQVIADFNRDYYDEEDRFSSLMISLKDQNNMGVFVDYSNKLLGLLLLIFVLAMSVILWNTGLLGGLRRYGEFGMRLAIGEDKNHVYRTMIYESIMISIIGSLAGVSLGLLISSYLQNHGIDLGIMMENATIMIPSVFRARITTQTIYIGFIPGVLSTIIGAMLAGIGIYRRQTAKLIKELQT